MIRRISRRSSGLKASRTGIVEQRLEGIRPVAGSGRGLRRTGSRDGRRETVVNHMYGTYDMVQPYP